MSCRYCNQKIPAEIKATTTTILPSLVDLSFEEETPRKFFNEDTPEYYKNDYQRDLVRYFQALKNSKGLPLVLSWLNNPAQINQIRNKSAFAKVITAYGQPVERWAEKNLFTGENGTVRSLALYILNAAKTPADFLDFVWQQIDQKKPPP